MVLNRKEDALRKKIGPSFEHKMDGSDESGPSRASSL